MSEDDALTRDLNTKIMDDVVKTISNTVDLYELGGGKSPRPLIQLQISMHAASAALLGISTVLSASKTSSKDSVLFSALLCSALFESVVYEEGRSYLDLFKKAHDKFEKLQGYSYCLGGNNKYDLRPILAQAERKAS